MNLKVEICTKEKCKVYVKDVTPQSSSEGYLPEDSTTYMTGRFRYSDTGSITAIYLMRSDSKKNKITDSVYQSHEDYALGEMMDIPIKFDGVFSVYYIVLPTKAWFDRMKTENPDILRVYDVLYLIDGTSIVKAIYSGDDFTLDAADLEEVIERNTEGTTISRFCDVYVSICFLTMCYLSLCKQIFDAEGFSECNSHSQIDSELLYKRDLVWMTLNVVKYMVEFENLQEAQRIIENIGGCNGLCKGWYEGNNRPANCGCGCAGR